ncbi:MAG: Gfo/Idh/MocA family oxidoreductase [Planctomycetes bacterium]|nr:Gfo/Idh/MocA family oxidoreductase [Planctomycetota bacterium]
MKSDSSNTNRQSGRCACEKAALGNGKAVSRRDFVRTAGSALAGLTIVPRYVLGGPRHTSPSETIQIAGAGVGGIGHAHLGGISQQAGAKIVALCDVDDVYAERTYKRFSQAKRYRDYREMLDAEGDKIDAVYCGTPDHTHHVISLAAIKKGKHVCCVKPLTLTIQEGRILAKAARQAGVATQVTASANTSDPACRLCEMIWDGAIGDVREAHVWSNRPLWPQGMLRPPGKDPIPNTLDWDLWIGPAAMRPFVAEWRDGDLALRQVKASKRPRRAVYHPWNFRGWWDFGTGALGDMGCHHFNIPKRALKLGHPVNISATSTRVMPESAPLASIVTWEFPAREGMPPLKAVWYDGGLKPPRPSELEPGRDLPQSAVLYVGDKGKMLDRRIIPESKMKTYTQPPKTLQRRGGTWSEWFEAMRGGQSAACRFNWASPLTEIVLLGNIAIRTGKRIDWDGENMRITNDRDANKYIKEPYHNDWSLEV